MIRFVLVLILSVAILFYPSQKNEVDSLDSGSVLYQVRENLWVNGEILAEMEKEYEQEQKEKCNLRSGEWI